MPGAGQIADTGLVHILPRVLVINGFLPETAITQQLHPIGNFNENVPTVNDNYA